METMSTISFSVTPEQKETIELRTDENGFDDVTTYIKVAAFKMQPFSLNYVSPSEEASIELEIQLTESQKMKIEENMKKSDCEDLATFLRYVGLHGVISAVVEVRSTGNLDAILQRIADSKK